jgi:DNA-binding response OmpR family regulator
MRLQQMPGNKQHTARILIVEDEPVIALTLEEVLIDAGFAIAGVETKLDKALALIESGACDAAIVDANLAGVSASPVAISLAARGLPYILMSGYSPNQMRGEYPRALFLSKPCRPELLLETLNSMLLGAKTEAAQSCHGSGYWHRS